MEKSINFLSKYREEILKCTSCGFCQAGCPVFGASLRPAYNTRGKMLLLKEIMEGFIEPSADLVETFYTCTTCRACTRSCPRHIEAAEIVEEVRRGFYAQGFAPEDLLGIRDNICRTGNVYGADEVGRIEIYPPSLREKFQEGTFKKKAETLVFMGCLPSYLDMRTVPSLVKILDSAKADYTTLASGESCCGFPLFLIGSDEFESHAEGLIEKIKATGARELVTPCAGCYRTFKNLYPETRDFGISVYHTVQYLDKLVREGRLKLKENPGMKITYHDPCDLGRACGIFDEPRNILNSIYGFKLVEMSMNRLDARCCGGGGNLQAHHPELARDMATKRIRDALAVGAEVIVSSCPACKDNLKKGARLIPREERGKIKIVDITEVVSDAIS